MKLQTIKKFFTLLTTIILSVSLLIIYNSCQKEISAGILKTNVAATTNAAASSSIIYTDVNPDSIIVNKLYNLDLNNDGIPDFKITDSIWRSCAPVPNCNIEITPLNNNAVLSDAKNHPYALKAKDTIALNLSSWSKTSDQTLEKIQITCSRTAGIISHYSGHWDNTSEQRYMGLKLIKGANTYYGWVGLSSSTYSNLPAIVTDYAFNSIPNQPILAGQTK